MAGPGNGGKTRVAFDPVDVELDRRERLEGEFGVGENQLNHPLDEVGFDRRVGPPFDPRHARTAPAAKQHVDHRIDQAGIDSDEPEIFPFLGLEHRQDGGQRDRVDIIAEAHRGDAIERDFNVVGCEIAQRGRQQPDQPVEDDFEHRQTLVGDHRAVDDGANAGIVVQVDIGKAETEQAVDFFLIEDALGAAFRADLALVDHGGPGAAAVGRCADGRRAVQSGLRAQAA